MKASDVKGTYKPTDADKKRLAKERGYFTLSGDGVFHTIQGEGNNVGKPITFVRLHYCNLACEWCDTPYTWHKGMKEYWVEPTQIPVHDLEARMLTDQTIKGIEDPIYRACFTGGEPLIHQHEIEMFVRAHPNWEVEIETNGTLLPNKFLLDNVKFNCSPKLACSGNKGMRTFNEDALEAISDTEDPCFKFVCRTIDDLLEVQEKYPMIPREQVYIMPEGVTKEENTAVYEEITAAIISLGFNTTPRLQNIMFDGAKRGV